jgi:hypothetical protein
MSLQTPFPGPVEVVVAGQGGEGEAAPVEQRLFEEPLERREVG